MYKNDTIIVNDGQIIDKNFAKTWDIFDYCKQFNGKLTISFVGVVIKSKQVLFSFPKHYNVEKVEQIQKQCMKQILCILYKGKTTYGSFDKGLKGEFPVKSYFYILDYYKKHGLYLYNENYYENGYNGNIDWNKTINYSNRIIRQNGIIFFPFVTKKNRDRSVFISECMNYVLEDACNYREYISDIMLYSSGMRNKNFNNLLFVIKELKSIQNTYFKDVEKRLIFNLIEYFEWKSKAKDNVKLLTFKFENYWESMINVYLNDKFYEFNGDEIIWGTTVSNMFTKPSKEYVECKEVREIDPNRNHYQIQYDHISINNVSKNIIIFDSKYFSSEINQLNYKQLFYNYNLKQKYPNYDIKNGLLLPTDREYYIKVHLDRTNLDNVKIIEHYINLNLVLDHYVQKI